MIGECTILLYAKSKTEESSWSLQFSLWCAEKYRHGLSDFGRYLISIISGIGQKSNILHPQHACIPHITVKYNYLWPLGSLHLDPHWDLLGCHLYTSAAWMLSEKMFPDRNLGDLIQTRTILTLHDQSLSMITLSFFHLLILLRHISDKYISSCAPRVVAMKLIIY